MSYAGVYRIAQYNNKAVTRMPINIGSSAGRVTIAPGSLRLPTDLLGHRRAVGLSGSQDSRGCPRRCSRLDCRRWFWLVGIDAGKNGFVVGCDCRNRTLRSCGCRSRSKSRLRSRRRCVVGFAGTAVGRAGRRWRFRGWCGCWKERDCRCSQRQRQR